jgi:hypothetical protein
MEKRIYMSPLVEIEWCNTQTLMQVAPESDVPVEPGNSAPARREPAF